MPSSSMASLSLRPALAGSSQLQQYSQWQSTFEVRNSVSTENLSLASDSRSTPSSSTTRTTTRRQTALSLAGLSLILVAGSSLRAEAKDIPLFGIKRKVEEVEEAVIQKVEQAQEAVVEKVKEVVKEGEAEVTVVEAAVTEALSGVSPSVSIAVPASSSSESGVSPALQAGVVAGAELLAVVAASSVVSGLVSQK